MDLLYASYGRWGGGGKREREIQNKQTYLEDEFQDILHTTLHIPFLFVLPVSYLSKGFKVHMESFWS